jgi:hypothetical protein
MEIHKPLITLWCNRTGYSCMVVKKQVGRNCTPFCLIYSDTLANKDNSFRNHIR